MPETTTTAEEAAADEAARLFLPELDLTQLRTHEDNPRRKAKADPEMVQSVKESGLLQPLVVAPTGDPDVPYVLIDGHRRHDALKKARRRTAPAVVRPDLTTKGDQVEAMVLASLYRENLTPLEEAEAFEQLRDIRGFTQTRISEKTGVPVATIRGRLKLLKLSKPTQTKIHKGQLSLTDGLELVAFEDDPETQERLTKAAGTWSWESELHHAKRRQKARAHADDVEAQLQAQGVAELETEPGATWFGIRNGVDGPVEVAATHSEDLADHPGCCAYVRFDDYSGPVVKIVCTNPSAHTEQLDEAEQQRRAEHEAKREADRQLEHDHRVASDVRAAAVLRVADEVVLPAPVTDVLRALLPALIYHLPRRAQRIYGALVDDETLANVSDYYSISWETYADHANTVSIVTPTALTRRLTAVLVAASEAQITPRGLRQDHSPLVERYYELLEQLDHHMSDVDVELLARHRGEQAEGASA